MEEVHSNIYLAALNAALVIFTYFFVLVLGHLYLKYTQHIDIISILHASFAMANIPLINEIVSFLGFLAENIVTDTMIVAMLYAAYIANYKMVVRDGSVEVHKGFLVVSKEVFPLGDVEQVFTEKHPFFPKTKTLCVKSLDDDVIKIPYVRNADSVKKSLLEKVRHKHTEQEVEFQLSRVVGGVVQ